MQRVVVLLQRLKEETLIEAPGLGHTAHALTEEDIQLTPLVLLARCDHLVVHIDLVALCEVILDHHGQASHYLEQALAPEVLLVRVNGFHELAVTLLQNSDSTVNAILLANVEAGANLKVTFLYEVLEQSLIDKLLVCHVLL